MDIRQGVFELNSSRVSVFYSGKHTQSVSLTTLLKQPTSRVVNIKANISVNPIQMQLSPATHTLYWLDSSLCLRGAEPRCLARRENQHALQHVALDTATLLFIFLNFFCGPLNDQFMTVRGDFTLYELFAPASV